MSETLTLIGAAITWFTPLAATRVYENAFGLSYTSVNLACLSLTLFFLTVLSFVYMMVPYPTTIGRIAAIGGIFGIGAHMAAALYLKSLDPFTKIIFWIGAALIGLNFADILYKTIVTAVARTQEKLAFGYTSAANRYGSLTLIGFPVGILLSLVFTEFLYDVRDTYFTNDESAMKVCLVKGIFLLGLNLISVLGNFIFSVTPWASSDSSPLSTRASLWGFFTELFSPRTLIVAIELSLTVCGVFFMMM